MRQGRHGQTRLSVPDLKGGRGLLGFFKLKGDDALDVLFKGFCLFFCGQQAVRDNGIIHPETGIFDNHTEMKYAGEMFHRVFREVYSADTNGF